MKIMQFGEGNFLRAFVDYMVDAANEAGVTDAHVTIVKAIPAGSLELFRKQNFRYTLLTRGRRGGKVIEETRTIASIENALCAYEDWDGVLTLARDPELGIVVSNTTEAGIAVSENDAFDACPPQSYPAKLTKLLYERYLAFDGAPTAGLYILPCELIENNARELERCVRLTAKKWGLPEEFTAWVDSCCPMCVTLVDRIVTGYSKEESERRGDPLLDIGEPFALWVIEDKADIKNVFPLDRAGLPVIFTDDVSPYRERKVRILNGAHTSTVLAAYLAGKSIVRECMQDPVISAYMKNCVNEEIIPTINLPKAELEQFAAEVFERFDNPFIDHALLSIALNSVSKWKARLLGSYADYYKINGIIPRRITFSLAALAAFYCDTDKSKDSPEVLTWFACHKADDDFVTELLANADFWGEDLNNYPGMTESVTKYLNEIRTKGAYEAMKCL